MKGTEKIIAHIQADAKAQADAILAQAEQQCAAIREEFEKKASEQYGAKIRAGVKACQDRVDSMDRIAGMEARKGLLSLKQEMVSLSFEKALDQLVALPQEQYVALLSKLAAKEAQKYGDIRVIYNSDDRNHCYIPTQDQLVINPDASYVHYCANNTVYGTEWKYIPETGNVPLVCDMSSNILSKPIDVAKYGIIYAGAQKNMAPAGAFAAFLGNEENQILRFEKSGQIPANINAGNSESVQSDPLAAVIAAEANTASVMQPTSAEFGAKYWTYANTIPTEIRSGELTKDNVQDKLDQFVKAMTE